MEESTALTKVSKQKEKQIIQDKNATSLIFGIFSIKMVKKKCI